MSNQLEKSRKTAVVPREYCGIPTLVNFEKDLPLHKGFPGDSFFIVANMKGSDQREFNFLIHMGCMNPFDADEFPIMVSAVTFTDRTNKIYIHDEVTVHQPDFIGSTEKLEMRCDASYIVGTLDRIETGGNLPNSRGRIDVKMERNGPGFGNGALGYFPYMNDLATVYHYSVPSYKATGTLIIDGKELTISGEAWFDRQWQNMPAEMAGGRIQTKWMNLNLDNGYKISLWDVIVHDGKENAFATVLSPEGVVSVVDMVPLAKGESDFWLSLITGNSYPTKYVVEFPSLDSKINVSVYEGMPEQEVASVSGYNRYEASSTFEGVFMGKPVKGFNCIELVGNFAVVEENSNSDSIQNEPVATRNQVFEAIAKTPLGKKTVILDVAITNGEMTGTLSVMGKMAPIENGVVDADGSFSCDSSLHTPAGETEAHLSGTLIGSSMEGIVESKLGKLKFSAK